MRQLGLIGLFVNTLKKFLHNLKRQCPGSCGFNKLVFKLAVRRLIFCGDYQDRKLEMLNHKIRNRFRCVEVELGKCRRIGEGFVCRNGEDSGDFRMQEGLSKAGAVQFDLGKIAPLETLDQHQIKFIQTESFQQFRKARFCLSLWSFTDQR